MYSCFLVVDSLLLPLSGSTVDSEKEFHEEDIQSPLDWLEEKTTGMSDTILVNSNFTGEQIYVGKFLY